MQSYTHQNWEVSKAEARSKQACAVSMGTCSLNDRTCGRLLPGLASRVSARVSWKLDLYCGCMGFYAGVWGLYSGLWTILLVCGNPADPGYLQ